MSSNKVKQELYIKYLTQGIEKREAMKLAGYSDLTIHCKANQIHENALKKYDIKNLTEKALENQLKQGIPLKPLSVKTPEELLEWWSNILDDDNVKLDYKIKVSELIAKCHGMFIQKVEVTNHNYSDIINTARERLLDSNTIDITPDNEVINIQ